MSVLTELRRRNVIRMAGLYLVGAWLIVQVAETVLPAFDVPSWVLRAIVIVAALGFLPALVFAWIFELTPDGLKRDADVVPEDSIAPQTAKRMNRMFFALLLAALTYFAIDKFVLDPRRDAELVTQTTAQVSAAAEAEPTKVADKSIAVLPFADFSPGSDQAWFADGLSEEILNALTRTPDLLVSARTSSFRYKGSELAITQIAKELGVAHVLEGSVRSTPQRIRVTAQLIRAADGFHLWSQTYDRDVADMIGIQEDLARAIATAMRTSMDPKALADMAVVGTRSVEAYQAYLRGIAKGSLDADSFKEAYAYFEQARTLDPAFAAAHAYAALFWQEQLGQMRIFSGLTDASSEDIGRQFDERIDQAIRHAPEGIDRLGYEAAKAYRELRLRQASDSYQAVLAERPADILVALGALNLASLIGDDPLLRRTLDVLWPQTQVSAGMANQYLSVAFRMSDKRRFADEAVQLVQRWPDSASTLYQAHRALLWDRRVEDAADMLARWQALAESPGANAVLPPARQACAEGRRAEVEAMLDAIPASAFTQRWHLLMLLGRQADAAAALEPLERGGQVFALTGFMIYPEFDPGPFPTLMRLLEREKIDRPPPQALPYACPPAGNPP